MTQGIHGILKFLYPIFSILGNLKNTKCKLFCGTPCISLPSAPMSVYLFLLLLFQTNKCRCNAEITKKIVTEVAFSKSYTQLHLVNL